MAAPVAAFTVIPTADLDPDSPLTTGLVSSLRDNTENVFAQLVGDPVGTPTFVAAAEHDHDGVNSKIVSGADFILVEKKLITGDVTDVTFSGLDGDTDEVYKLVGRIRVTGTSPIISLEPNSLATNQDSIVIENGVSLAGASPNLLVLANGIGASDELLAFEAIFWAKSDPNSIASNRILQALYSVMLASTVASAGQASSLWDDDSTNITSLVVHTSIASDIRDGSTIALYKLRQ